MAKHHGFQATVNKLSFVHYMMCIIYKHIHIYNVRIIYKLILNYLLTKHTNFRKDLIKIKNETSQRQSYLSIASVDFRITPLPPALYVVFRILVGIQFPLTKQMCRKATLELIYITETFFRINKFCKFFTSTGYFIT